MQKQRSKSNLTILFSLCCLFFVLVPIHGQTKKQLERQRYKLKKEIKQINKLLSKTKKNEKNLLSRLGDINKKLEIREKLIQTINEESLAYAAEINKNKREIKQLENQLTQLKKEHADLVMQSYKNKNQQHQFLFLVSSANFKQAYNRMQYLKQFADQRKKQANKIKFKKELLLRLNDSLEVLKSGKDLLIKEKQDEKKAVDDEKSKQEELINEVKKEEKKYTAQIQQKQRADQDFEDQLTKLINGAIERSSSKTSQKGKKFGLTPEGKKLANSFVASKGKLPHPVVKGYVSRYFGERPHEELKRIKVKSNGWHYITEDNGVARSVFKGTVYAILVDRKTKLKTVLLQHGNYFTAYKNLSSIFVEKGDKVKAKEDLGYVHKDKTTGKTKLAFAIMKNAVPQNPKYWMSK